MTTSLEPSGTRNLLQLDTQIAIPASIDPMIGSNSFHTNHRENHALPKTLRGQRGTKHTISLPLIQEYKPQEGFKKPRRGPKYQSSQEAVSAERVLHLERNRVAANKCRLKKKRELEGIERVLNFEAAKRDALLAEVNLAKDEIWQLKNQIFEHAQCRDHQIELQITKMTRKILESSSLQCPPLSVSSSSCFNRSMGEGMETDLSKATPATSPLDDLLAYPIFEGFIDLSKM
ncbi:unnamed protein product [Penicillium salamii]|uniref:BZIP domain-containing protein n=2 Tax=Penicillium TaxID=5073 RepID=A0A9W4N7M7_9EURO|nr:hypothetical protein HAV15_009068 [Penicillium sp. str. \